MTASSSNTSAGTVVTVAPTGAHAKADVPHLPVSTEEVAAAVADCERVGASVVDLEPRHDTALPDVVAAVRARSGLIVRVTAYARSETLETLLGSGADVVTCPADAPEEFVADLRQGAQRRDVAVHYEVRDTAQLDRLRQLGIHPAHVVLVFGGEHGMPGGVTGVAAAIAALPGETTFTATGIEQDGVPVMLAALAAGGHVRVGMADTLTYSRDDQGDHGVRDNTQLAARAAGVAKIAQRPPLPVDRARELLDLPPKS